MGRSLYRDLNRRFGPRIDAFTRREMMKASLASGAAMLLSHSGLARAAERPAAGAKRVVVIGAGFGGLACAHELKAAGYDVTVIEARDRAGGRVLSFNQAFGNEFIAGRNVEGGAELIGSNHPTWVAYADRFGLEFLDVSESEGVAYPVVIDGRRLDDSQAEELWGLMEEALSGMDPLAEPLDPDAPWSAANAAELDATPIQKWIDGLDADELTKKACWINQSADNGVDPANASLLGQLASIKGHGLERYWTDTEVYRCKGGNSLLTRALAQSIGADRIILGLPVTRVEAKGGHVVVTCRDGRTIECDDVVLAIPPGLWPKVEFAPGLPAALKPQMGVNVKYLAHLKSRFWNGAKLSPDALGNGPVQMTWDGTDGQEGDADACMIAFSGGSRAEQVMAFEKDQRDEEYAGVLSAFYPDWKEHFVRSRFMDWPRDPWTRASYSFPAPGQVTVQGPIMARGALEIGGKPRLHFAGEHACYRFVGYMEGGLYSGAAVAGRLAARDGVLSPAK